MFRQAAFRSRGRQRAALHSLYAAKIAAALHYADRREVTAIVEALRSEERAALEGLKACEAAPSRGRAGNRLPARPARGAVPFHSGPPADEGAGQGRPLKPVKRARIGPQTFIRIGSGGSRGMLPFSQPVAPEVPSTNSLIR